MGPIELIAKLHVCSAVLVCEGPGCAASQTFAKVTDQVRCDMYLHPHLRHYIREVRVVVYTQVHLPRLFNVEKQRCTLLELLLQGNLAVIMQ